MLNWLVDHTKSGRIRNKADIFNQESDSHLIEHCNDCVSFLELESLHGKAHFSLDEGKPRIRME